MFKSLFNSSLYRLILILSTQLISGSLYAEYVKFKAQNSHQAVIQGIKNTIYL